MRVAELDVRTEATSIDGMAAIKSHMCFSDEHLISCTIFFVIQKNAEIACVTIMGK
jgi:hypothetical protein